MNKMKNGWAAKRKTANWLVVASVVAAIPLVVGVLQIHSFGDKNAAAPKGAEPKGRAGDWPMWGGSVDRNMANPLASIPNDFEPLVDEKTKRPAKHIAWTAELGSQTYGNPVVATGKVFVGTNNGAQHRPKYQGDHGCLLAFDEQTGAFLWQLTREKLPEGRVNDWPEQGICSTACVEGNRLWVVTNRAELICVDTEGFRDNENDGQIQDEKDTEAEDADIVWNLDMIEELGVFPHNLATSSPVICGDHVFILTSNGVDESHKQVVLPRAPSFIAVNKTSGKVVWESHLPGNRILHGQWSSPTVGIVNGNPQIYFGGGDGWLYALQPNDGKLIWKFDMNPKNSIWRLYGRGTRNNIVSTPVFHENSVVLAVGQDPDHGYGVGHLFRIDATKQGDVSPTLILNEQGKQVVLDRGEPLTEADGYREVKNPNSAEIWHYGGIDPTAQKNDPLAFTFGRTMSTAAIHDSLIYLPDIAGLMHCVDFETGKRQWRYDMLARCWGSATVLGNRVLVGDEDGSVRIFETGRQLNLLRTINFGSSVYSTPVYANGKLFVAGRSKLFAIE